MKLNLRDKNELRMEIKELVKEISLEDVAKGKRVHLDKEFLEWLLFDEIVYNKEKNLTLKLPAWSGPFLSRIDLSEVSFEDVAWSLLGYKFVTNFGNNDIQKKINNVINGLNYRSVDYSSTNANIDFTKSWEAKNLPERKPIIVNCDFSFMDLSKFSINDFEGIYCCDLSKTKMLVPNLDLIFALKLQETYLDNLDMKNISIDISKLGNDEVSSFHTNYFCDTGLKITCDLHSGEVRALVSALLQEGKIYDCYLNGKKLLSKAERHAILMEKHREHQELKNKLIDSIRIKVKDIKKAK